MRTFLSKLTPTAVAILVLAAVVFIEAERVNHNLRNLGYVFLAGINTLHYDLGSMTLAPQPAP